MKTYHVIDPPDQDWLTRLRRKHTAYDPKGNRFVRIEWAWEPPEPGGCAGRIGICPMWQEHDGWHIGEPEYGWYVKPDGTGFDGLHVLLPVEDNCPDESPPISDVWQRHVEGTLALHVQHIEDLEEEVRELIEQQNRIVHKLNLI